MLVREITRCSPLWLIVCHAGNCSLMKRKVTKGKIADLIIGPYGLDVHGYIGKLIFHMLKKSMEHERGVSNVFANNPFLNTSKVSLSL